MIELSHYIGENCLALVSELTLKIQNFFLSFVEKTINV